MVSCTFVSLVNPLIQIWRGTQLYTLQGPMKGILQSRTIPTHLVMGSFLGPMTLMRDLPLILTFDEFGDYTQRAIQTLSIVDDSSSTLPPCSTLMTNQHVFRTNQHDVSPGTPDYEKFRPYFGWVNVDTVQKPWNSLPNGESPYPIHSL